LEQLSRFSQVLQRSSYLPFASALDLRGTFAVRRDASEAWQGFSGGLFLVGLDPLGFIIVL